ncbi:MAG: hypothetical protein GEU95_20995 [Rhizobiales bacterium]|nr:hypothetical protein [Hyphomicrobiales bacterium]
MAYNAAAVATRSAFFSPTEIGALPDNKVHTIAYRAGLATAYYCSEPKGIKSLTYDDVAEQLGSQFQQHRFREIARSAREVRESVLELASPPMRDGQAAIEERIRTVRVRRPEIVGRPAEEEQAVTDILVTREIARVDLGADLVIAQPRA